MKTAFNKMVVFLTLMFAALGFAQNSGPQVFDSYQEEVNLETLQPSISIPIFGKNGRSLGVNFPISNNGASWSIDGASEWQGPGGPWVLDRDAFNGSVTVSGSSVICVYPHHIQKYEDWRYIDTTGTSHSNKNSKVTTYAANTCGFPTSSVATADDGSGYLIQVTNSTSVKITRPDGTMVYNSTLQQYPNTVTDRNGNRLSYSAAYNPNDFSTTYSVVDTLGTTPLTVRSELYQFNHPPGPSTYTWTAPNGQSVHATLNLGAYTRGSNFGCPGVSESGNAAIYLPSSLVLPDGSQYSFTYAAVSGHPTWTNGRLASVTPPTGGVISYDYSGYANDDITCGVYGPNWSSAGRLLGIKKTTPDGPTQYTSTLISYVSGHNAQYETTVIDPQGNKTEVFFSRETSVVTLDRTHETERLIYSGTSNLLRTIITCYNGLPNPCTSASNTQDMGEPITQMVVQTILPSGQVSETDTFLDRYGFLTTSKLDYDYGAGASGLLLSKVVNAYGSWNGSTCVALGNNITSLPCQNTVYAADGTTMLSNFRVSYDETGVSSTTGTPQLVSVTGSRGNPTTSANLVSGSAYQSSTATYYDTGNVNVVTAPNLSTLTFGYAGGCGNSFPTSITRAAGLVSYSSYDCTGGVAVSHTNENGGIFSTGYTDASFWRPSNTTDELGNQTVISYLYSGSIPTGTDVSLTFDGGNGTAISNSRSFLDSLGRAKLVQSKQGPSSSNYSTVERDLDSRGQVVRQTNPYTSTYGQLNGTIAGVLTTYDGLGRIVTTTGPGGDVTTISRAATEDNDALVTLTPLATGENAKVKNVEVDGLGRTTSVCEVSSGLPGVGACSQHTAKTGYLTSQSLDALGRVLSIAQGSQNRTFSYDGLSRVLSQTTPESGIINFTFDSATGCVGTSADALIKRVDANANTTCYQYDSLGRVVTITYSGIDAANTPEKHFVYDSATVDGFSMTYAAGKLAEQYTGPSNAKITDEGFSYDQQGNLTTFYEMTPHAGGSGSGWYVSSINFYPNHALRQLISSLGTIQYSLDSRGRLYGSITNPGSFQTVLVSGTIYDDATSALLQTMYGNSDHDDFTYEDPSLRMKTFGATIGSTPHSQTGTLTWNPNGSVKTLVLADWFNSANAQTCNYTADDVARLASVDCGASTWQQNFSYDRYGNVKKTVPPGGTGLSFLPTYSATANQMTGGYTYNGNGDLLTDGVHTYTWDAENKPASIDGITLTKDAVNRVVEQNNGGVYTEIQYTPLGRFGTMTGQATKKLNVALPGGGTAEYSGLASVNILHPDNLSSSRITSSFAGRVMAFDTAFAPFGEAYASSGTTDRLFTGHRQDTVVGLYDTENRENDPSEGRWVSPDPIPGSIGNPQSLNRYAYVANRPLTSTDPLGLEEPCNINPKCHTTYIVNGAEVSERVGQSVLSAGGGPSPFKGNWNPGRDISDTFQDPNGLDVSAPEPGTGETLTLSVNSKPAFTQSEFMHLLAAEEGDRWRNRAALGLVLGRVINGVRGIFAARSALLSTGIADAAKSRELVTVLHSTTTETAEKIVESGSMRAGTYVTLPSAIPPGASPAEIEEVLGIDAGKGTAQFIFQTPASNLGFAPNGLYTSGNAIQWVLLNPQALNP